MGILENLGKLTALFLMIAGVPGYLFLVNLTKDPILSIIFIFIYEIVIFIGSFITKVWGEFEGGLVKGAASRIKIMFAGYRKRYFEYVIYQHRYFDVKGLRSQGPYNLELAKVFVDLRVAPTPLHQIKSNPIEPLPKNLRTGNHSIWDFINDKRMGNQNLAILGSPGCGKTTLFKHVAIALATTGRKRQKHIPDLLPVLLFLRDHASSIKENPEIRLADLIIAQFKQRDAPLPPDDWLDQQLQSGKCLIMLDGLDEVADIGLRKSVVAWVEKCMGAHGKNKFLISSRPHGYKTNEIANVTVLQIQSFTHDQVRQFVQHWYLANELMSSQRDDAGVRADAKLGAYDLLNRIFITPTLSELTVNPLLLTMIATVHRYRSSLPGRRVELYAEICEVFLGKRQQARGLDLDLTPTQKQRVLQPLAFKMMQDAVREVNKEDLPGVLLLHLVVVSPKTDCIEFIKDIENSSGILVERESGRYSFSHLTFQEYLAATHILENHLEDELTKQVDNPWWHETIRLYCAQTDASAVIQACLNSSNISTLSLAINCMEEAREVSLTVRNQFASIIEAGLESTDPERRRLIAEVKLNTRIKGS